MPHTFLLYTSAGDNNNIKSWLAEKEYDIWISYYGESKNKLSSWADYYEMRKGGKFPNLLNVYKDNKKLFDKYDYVCVSDDDIKISGQLINFLFKTCKEYDLWIAQPAFLCSGKISHSITRKRHFSFLRYTDFVEMTCPIFRTDKLREFLDVYDDELLLGYGMDWWFMEVLNPPSNKIAVIDYYPCINPFDTEKRNIREIDTLQDLPTRRKNWDKLKKAKNFTRDQHKPRMFRSVYTVASVLYGLARSDLLIKYFSRKLIKSIMKKLPVKNRNY